MAADTFKFKRGTTAAVNAYLPAVGEPVYDITLKRFTIGDGVTLGGVVPSNAFTADKLTTARSISLTGSVTGTVSFDGSANVAIATSVGTSLQASLDLKAPLASPALTGTPTAPTAAVDTNTTQVASTAFVVGQAGAATPIIDGTGTAGVSLRYSRQDHVHPTDTSRAPLASPALTGTPTAPTASTGISTTQIATTAFVRQEIDAQLTWTNFTLQNSWAVTAGRRAVYRKILGQVQIEFGVVNGTATDGTVLATLPVGFRPSTQIGLPVVAAPNVAPGAGVTNPRVVINTDGTITCQNVSSANGVSFSVLMPLN